MLNEKIKELDKEIEGSIVPLKCKLIYRQQNNLNINIKLGYLGYNPQMLQNNCVFFYDYLAHNYIPYEAPLEISINNLIEINLLDIDMINYKKIFPPETPVEINHGSDRYDLGYLKDKNNTIKQVQEKITKKIKLYKSLGKGKFTEPLKCKDVTSIISLETIKTIKFPFAN